jgi:hypothetical protein
MAGTGLMKGATEGLSSYGLNPMISKALGLGTTAVTPTAGTTSATTLPKEALMGPGFGFQGAKAGAMGSAITPQFGASIIPIGLGNLPSTTPATTTQPTTQVPDISKVTPTVAEGYTAPVGIAAQGVAKQGLGSVLGSLASPAIQTAAGLLTTGASALPANAEFENVASLEQLRNEIATKGSSPALYTRAKRALEEGYTDARTELDTIYNQAGMIDSGEYRDAVAKLETKKADANELLAAQIDEQTMNDLLGLTNLDVSIAAAKYGADAADVAALRQILGTAGGTMLSSGLKGLGVTQ